MYLHSLLFILGASTLIGVSEGSETIEQRLRMHLMNGYDKNSLPSTNTTRVALRYTVRHVNMIESEDIMELHLWVMMLWQDPRLTWSEVTASHVPNLAFRQDELWHPDVTLFNDAAADKKQDLSSILTMVHPDGEVLFIYPTVLRVACVADLTAWPYDVHNCSAKFGSWVHDGYTIDLEVHDDSPEVKLDLPRSYHEERNLTRGQWTVLASSLQKSTVYFPCCYQPFPHISLRMLVQRNAPAYAYTVQVPAFMLSIVTGVVFILPPMAVEKVVVGVLVIILNLQFLTYITATIPHSPSHTPLIVMFVSEQLVLTAIVVVITAVIVRLVRDPHQNSLPRCCQRALAILAYCFCLGSYRKSASKSENTPYPQGLKGEDLELGETYISHSFSNGHVPGTPSSGNNNTSSPSQRAPYDYLLLGAIIDRACLILYIIVMISSAISFRSVLFGKSYSTDSNLIG